MGKLFISDSYLRLFEVLWGQALIRLLVIPSAARNLARPEQIPRRARNDKWVGTPQFLKEPHLFSFSG